LGFFRSISRGRGALIAFAVMNFVLVASTNNSLSTKSPSLVLFSIALIGIPLLAQRRRSPAGAPLRYELPMRDGVWS